MKTTLIRIFAIMTLATSMSAFAMSEKPKDAGAAKANKANCTETTVSYPVDQPSSNDRSDEDNAKSRQQKIKEQNKQWLHDLQTISAG